MTKNHPQQMRLASKTSEPAGPMKTERSTKSPPSSVSDTSQHDGEDFRGRRQDRDRSTTAKEEDDSADDKDSGNGASGHGKPRKRKRSRKGLDKNFPCPHQGCGKSYSRAEHLYRHQLNHTPKKIYTCDFPSCNRQFVRQDLCTRHRERHTARGSHLQRKEPYGHDMDSRPILSPTVGYREPQDSVRSPALVNGGGLPGGSHVNASFFASPMGMPSLPGRMSESQQPRPHSATAGGGHMKSPASYRSPTGSDYGSIVPLNRSNSDDQYYNNSVYRNYDTSTARSVPNSNFDLVQRQNGSETDSRRQQIMAEIRSNRSTPHNMTAPASWNNPLNSNYNLPNSSSYTSNYQAPNGGSDGSFTPSQNFAPSSFSLPPPLVASANQNTSQVSITATTPNPTPFETGANVSTPGSSTIDNTMADRGGFQYHMPAYQSENHTRSPYAMADDFAAWLFSDPNLSNTSTHELGHGPIPFGQAAFAEYHNPMFGAAEDSNDGGPLNVGYIQPLPPPHTMAVDSILDAGQNSDTLSKEKWTQLLDLISQRFNETDHAPVRKQKEDLLQGDREDENHVLSIRMMKTYIGSYWFHFHPQLPILHKPTFSADKTQNLLLIAVIAIGASCLDKMHGPQVTQQGAELSNFLAWHLRGEIFKERDFTPPAELWVFQALLLLEVYEKMYSTRTLHERAHVFHATTLTLIRRGSSLIGRSAGDSPPPTKDERPGFAGNGLQELVSPTPDEWWKKWVTNEATRRMCFAAFIVDNLHATMFGHTVTMVAHEMKLPLPCDESLWSATSSADVSRIEAGLVARGIKSITFFDGLKWTLTGQPVRTNSFGRTALMAGLLNVSWHMNQRDVQVRTLQASQSLGGKARWRSALTRAFDYWKDDFEQTGVKDSGATSTLYQSPNRLDEDNIFESKTVLHHLAHMAMHVDVVSCQIYANAKRLLGRTTLPNDYDTARKRIRDQWAPKASARDATFYSLKFLQKVLVADMPYPQHNASEHSDGISYSARDDFLLNRPWVLYFAALIVWSYGYALDGPIASVPDMTTKEQQVQDMRRYLTTVGGVKAPDDLATLRDRNACMGMLYILRDMFGKCRWELLHEAAILLTNCIDMLRG